MFELEVRLREGLSELDQRYTDQQIQKLIQYLSLLDRWNATFNLTAIKNPDTMLTRHVLDSLAIAPYLHGERFIDVGTGAGLPGIPLAIVNPHHQYTLLDSNGKKTRFLFQAKALLNLTNVQEVQQRVELYRAKDGYDGILSRAFTSLAEMVRSTQHLLAPDGRFFAMKGKLPGLELNQLPKNYHVEAVIKLTVPQLQEERHLVIIRRRLGKG
ncbi:MAG: 16S rRNA (guanine(527)-N(7))-methyltransferase RsmG [Gammaproteobacteria bacterium]|nr:MAG: 16S rRNA (guanine(527)-N(7))-methyltransferase RsmG [Gammaproteobacteria bacterium]RLA54251.1 MAG: 16S rRNA (guanine(527)-N(7))-methyltransferase RsmG [Gammaproteobacteria bacterium]